MLKGNRDDVVLATKFHGPMGSDANEQGNSRRWIMRAIEGSLRRLDTDHVDLYQIHRPDPDTSIEETIDALTDLVRAGKIRAWGTSTFPAAELVEACWAAERRNVAEPHSEQPPSRSSTATSNVTSCRCASATGSACSCGARWRVGG